MLAGCGGLVSQFASINDHSSHRASSLDSELLYVSDWAAGEIFVFSYPAGALVATIADDRYPLGLCSDSKGNVWVTNFGAGKNQIVEYAHGGTTPIATLDDPKEEPRGCAVDPTTGNLAVVNGGRGSVSIYSKASGTPQAYEPDLVYPFACTYDDSGDLFVDGYHLRFGDKFALSELPSGSAAFQRVRVKESVGLPGDLQWDGENVAAGDDESPSVIYLLHVSRTGKYAKLEDTISLEGPIREPPQGVQFWIQSGVLIMPFGIHKYVDEVGLWNYPAGGKYTSAIAGFGAKELYGVTVSVVSSPMPR